MLDFGVFDERLGMNRVTSLLSMRGMLLGNRFEPKPKSRALGTVGAVMTYGIFSLGCSSSGKTKDSLTR